MDHKCDIQMPLSALVLQVLDHRPRFSLGPDVVVLEGVPKTQHMYTIKVMYHPQPPH